jgi:hypothetical protein
MKDILSNKLLHSVHRLVLISAEIVQSILIYKKWKSLQIIQFAGFCFGKNPVLSGWCDSTLMLLNLVYQLFVKYISTLGT